MESNKAPFLYRNSLSFIRILSALQVIYGHLLVHLSLPRLSAGVHRGIVYFAGVPIFFVISGFLVWLSLERSLSWRSYIQKRFWRIYPELWVAVALEILTILFLYDGWEPVSLSLFAITQATVLQFWTPGSLRGYGCGTPNGTLWTLGVTVQFYICAWLLYKCLHRRKFPLWLAVFASLIAISYWGNELAWLTGYEILVKLFGQTIFRYLWLFFIGCFMAEFHDRVIPFLSRFWLPVLLAGIVFYRMPQYDIQAGYGVWWSLLLTGGLMGFAYRFPKLNLKADISYGLFLYHMIFTNIFIQMDWMGHWHYFFYVLILSCLSAYISMITVGKWSAGKKIR